MITTASRLPDGLLVSVRSSAEAEEAVRGGAAIVDAKEPADGPLAPVDAAVAGAIARAVAGRVPWTLACGELGDGAPVVADRIHRAVAAAAGHPPAAAKAGPAGLPLAEWLRAFAAVRERLPQGVELVAVAYADWHVAEGAHPLEIIDAAAASGASTVLVDTFDKSGPGIVELAGLEGLAGWIAAAAARGLRAAIAGRLQDADLPGVAAAGPAVVGVRSAACGGRRLGMVDAGQVRRLVGTLLSGRRVPRGVLTGT